MPKSRPQSVPLESRLIALLEKNLAVLEQLTAVLSRVEPASAQPGGIAGLLSREEICSILKVTPATLAKRMQRGRFPRPAHGSGSRALWRGEDLHQTSKKRGD